MRFGLLGPVEVGDESGTRVIKGAMPRTVLAMLLLDANTVVSADRLAEALWGAPAPDAAAASLSNHVTRLRRVLGEAGRDRIRAVAPGYLLRVEPGELDLDVFAGLCAQARQAARDGRRAESAELFTAALALWRGDPAADVPGRGIQDPRVQGLIEERAQALAGRIDAYLALGRPEEVVGELRVLTLQHPLREVFHQQLMLALYRAGRRAEALDAFQRLRRVLLGELGVEPSDSSRELHLRILRADPGLAVDFSADGAPPVQQAADSSVNVGAGTSTETVTVVSAVPPPGLTAVAAAGAAPNRSGARHQLPGDTRAFTGRARELERLVGLAASAPGGTDAGMVVISAIDGMGGIGKSALAVHVAHLVRDRFPDGQLFIDLRGHTTGLEPLTPGDALDWLLRSLGAAPNQIPQDLGERAAFYRDRLDGTRTLIILDNAAGTAQVRHLLPGSPGCLVLVTSRKRLTGLDDAHSLALDALPEQDAAALLHKVAGPGRIPAGHPAIAELIELCGHLPLAVRIVAARLRHRAALRIEDVVARLRDEDSRLDRLQDGDRDLTAVFDSSVAALPEAEQHLFRHLGLIPGPGIDAYAAANLLGADHRTAEHLLESLLDHNLLTEESLGRYRLHDLVRVYARTQVRDLAPADRDAAFSRLLDYYYETMWAANRHFSRHVRSGRVHVGKGLTAEYRPADRADALAWTRAEQENILAAIAQLQSAGSAGEPAEETPDTDPACEDAAVSRSRLVALTAAVADYLHLEGLGRLSADLHRAAAAAARANDDRLGEATALWDQGRAAYLLADYPASTDLNARALEIYEDLGDRLGEANAVADLSRARYMSADLPGSVALQHRALAIYRDLDVRHGQAGMHYELGRNLFLTGDFADGIAAQEKALEIFQELGLAHGEADAYRELGRLHMLSGDYATSAQIQERALTIYRDLGLRLAEANSLDMLGRVQYCNARYAEAGRLHEQSLAIHRDGGMRLAEANALWDLGRVSGATGDYPAAEQRLGQSLALLRDLRHRINAALVTWDLGRVRLAAGDHESARALFEQSLAENREIEHPLGVNAARLGLAQALLAAGDHEAVAPLLDEALAEFHKIGDRQAQAEAYVTRGALALATTGPLDAQAHYRQALDLALDVHSPIDEAHAREGLARCAHLTGDGPGARAELTRALAIYERSGAAETAGARASLAALAAGPADTSDTLIASDAPLAKLA